ncbi:MAG: protein kinase [Spirulinaceae cyanobacterium RM2_2_10]|nr:protein kinase [Spirulinaceae cyanobacterium SM2_1_0]NJO19610.1 protein kinase [Spirulinaceae cyanobacterium RM2_2_10]
MLAIALLASDSDTIRRQWQFSRQATIRIGRAPDNDIELPDALEVSRDHLELRPQQSSPENQRWHLTSRGANGTFLNGKLVTQGFVGDRDLLQLAQNGPRLRLALLADDPEAGTAIQPADCTHTGNVPGTLFCIYCGAPLVKQAQFVRDYQILRPLGQGGMGTTYLAWERQSRRTLVLKEMNADMARIAKARELFEREARVLRSLTHPGIPQYYDFFVANDKKYLAMELVAGENLALRIREKGPVAPAQAVAWMRQVCDILAYLHRLEPPLVHRDVKPANLMHRQRDGQIVLLDFGAVKEIGTPPGTRIGAEGYSAPEQERGKPLPQSDLFAVGATLVFLVSGAEPEQFYDRAQGEFRLDASRVPALTPALATVVNRVCAPQVGDRHATASELAQALAAADG